MTWLVVAVGSMKLDLGKWVANTGALFKVLIILALGIGGIQVAATDGRGEHHHVRRLAALVLPTPRRTCP